jgi:hypothetical protein
MFDIWKISPTAIKNEKEQTGKDCSRSFLNLDELARLLQVVVGAEPLLQQQMLERRNSRRQLRQENFLNFREFGKAGG